jgi:hypothetical protein
MGSFFIIIIKPNQMKKLLFLSLLSLFVIQMQAQTPSSTKSPDPIVNSPQNVCPYDSLLLGASGSTGNYNWFSDSLGMHFLDSGSTFQTGVITSDTIFYVQAYADSTVVYCDFTNCNVSGNTGPTQSDVNTAYSGTNLDGDVSITTQGIQEWVVPYTGEYVITAAGAQGGFSNVTSTPGGLGAKIESKFYLTQGTTLGILVGQQGESSNRIDGGGGGGGGASFVVNITASIPLLVAAGGGGATASSNIGHVGLSGSANFTTTSAAGTTNSGMNKGGNGGGYSHNAGGTEQFGGSSGSWLYWSDAGGKAYINGGIGGSVHPSLPNDNNYPRQGVGGFGSAGAASNTAGGGGGGYAGGNGSLSSSSIAGGGLSFNAGTLISAVSGVEAADGFVNIAVKKANSPSNIIAIVIKLDSVPGIITQPTNTSVVYGNNASFTVAAQGTNLSYQWQESINAGVNWTDLTNGGTYSGVTTGNLSLSAVPLSMDDYYYRCIVSGSCSPADTSDEAILSVTATGIEEVGLNSAQIYPNPVGNILTIEFDNAGSDQLHISVYDVLGKQQQEWKENSLTQGHHQLSLDVSTLAKGVYYLRIKLDEDVRDFRFVKE